MFYKGSLEQPGSIVSGMDDKQLMVAMVEKLFDFRNWHSHYCHRDGVLYFSDTKNQEEDRLQKTLQFFLESHLEMAADKCIKDDRELKEFFHIELRKTFKLFDDGRITQEGRIFFLQFFLTEGEMNKCLSGISGFKRTNNPQWQLKRKMFSFYSKRDGSSALAFIFKSNEQEEGKQSVEVKNQLRQFSVFNEIKEYLLKKPAIICTNFEIEQWRTRNEQEDTTAEERERQDTIRPINRFIHYALQYLLDFESELALKNRIEWRFRDVVQEKVTTEKEGKHYTKVKIKPVFGSRSYAAEKLYIKNGMAYFGFVGNEKTFLCSVNEQSLLYWIGAILLNIKNSDSITKNIYAYLQQYTSILNSLKDDKEVNFSRYPKIDKEFLHAKLIGWTNKTDESETEKKYKDSIRKKIKSILEDLNNLTPEKLQELKPAMKNRLLMKWYNYVLTADNKLSHIKDSEGRFSEIDSLSRFHYVPVNYSGELRKSLINDFKHRFPSYITETLFSKKHKSIDDIVYEMIAPMKSVFSFWQKITNEEKHPPEWQNTNKSPDELVSQPEERWSSMLIDDWHILARKLKIGNPFLTRVRKGSNQSDRKTEMLEYYEHLAIQIPKRVFIDEASITSMSESKVTIHKSFAKQVRESSLATGLSASLYEIKPDSDLPKVLAAEKSGYSAGAIVKEILYTKTTDALLWGICLAYHKKLFAAGKISSNATIDYETVIVSRIGEHQFNWTIGGKNIAIKQKQLRKMIYDYKLKEIEKIVSLGLNKEDTAEAIEKIFTDNYFNSLRFIQRSFELEETVVVGECTSDKYAAKSSHIDFNEILSIISSREINDVNKELLIELRNSAFHTKIPSKNSYEEGIKIIEAFLTKKGFPFTAFKKIETEESVTLSSIL